MYKDEIIEEVWRHRDEYARKHHHDLKKMLADLRKKQQEHPQRIVNRKFQK